MDPSQRTKVQIRLLYAPVAPRSRRIKRGSAGLRGRHFVAFGNSFKFGACCRNEITYEYQILIWPNREPCRTIPRTSDFWALQPRRLTVVAQGVMTTTCGRFKMCLSSSVSDRRQQSACTFVPMCMLSSRVLHRAAHIAVSGSMLHAAALGTSVDHHAEHIRRAAPSMSSTRAPRCSAAFVVKPMRIARC
jgi:hypothetical protein